MKQILFVTILAQFIGFFKYFAYLLPDFHNISIIIFKYCYIDLSYLDKYITLVFEIVLVGGLISFSGGRVISGIGKAWPYVVGGVIATNVALQIGDRIKGTGSGGSIGSGGSDDSDGNNDNDKDKKEDKKPEIETENKVEDNKTNNSDSRSNTTNHDSNNKVSK
jgi:hypothetical protein